MSLANKPCLLNTGGACSLEPTDRADSPISFTARFERKLPKTPYASLEGTSNSRSPTCWLGSGEAESLGNSHLSRRRSNLRVSLCRNAQSSHFSYIRMNLDGKTTFVPSAGPAFQEKPFCSTSLLLQRRLNKLPRTKNGIENGIFLCTNKENLQRRGLFHKVVRYVGKAPAEV